MTSRDLQSQLAGLAALESALWLAVRALHITYSPITSAPRDYEDIDITTARNLADRADEILVAVDAHRANVELHLKKLQHPDQIAWPF